MISKSVYETDIRVRREAETLADAGHRVTVVCLGSDDASSSGVSVIGLGDLSGLKGRRQHQQTQIYRAVRWLLLPTHRRLSNKEFARGVRQTTESLDLEADVVHAHDYPALEVSSQIAAEREAHLVYDSHEYWRGMTRHGRPELIASAIERRTERRLARQAGAVITVSDGAAQCLSEDLGVDNIAVVKNTFPTRADLSPPESPEGAVYAGRIGEGRDLETILSARVWNDIGLSLHLVGPNDNSIALPPSVRVHSPGPLRMVDELLAEMGIALVPLGRGPLNHEIALPNKLFQAISVGVPVVAADLPEMAKLVKEHGIGEVYSPGDMRSLGSAVQSVIEKYQELTDNVARSRATLEWSHDARVLMSVYESFTPIGE